MVAKFISTVCQLTPNAVIPLNAALGANLNAQIGLTNPAICGGDVCHVNLHKTFAMLVNLPSISSL